MFYPTTEFQKNACFILLKEGLKTREILAYDINHNELNLQQISKTSKYFQEKYNSSIAYFKAKTEKGYSIIDWCIKTSK